MICYVFPDLRKHARHLENEIDLKLVAFSKLGAGIKSPSVNAASDTVPLLSGEDTFETMALEIEDLLKKVRKSDMTSFYFEYLCFSS